MGKEETLAGVITVTWSWNLALGRQEIQPPPRNTEETKLIGRGGRQLDGKEQSQR